MIINLFPVEKIKKPPLIEIVNGSSGYLSFSVTLSYKQLTDTIANLVFNNSREVNYAYSDTWNAYYNQLKIRPLQDVNIKDVNNSNYQMSAGTDYSFKILTEDYGSLYYMELQLTLYGSSTSLITIKSEIDSTTSSITFGTSQNAIVEAV